MALAVAVMPTVPERTTSYVTATFKDKLGNQVAPASATYRIDCMTTGEEILDDTALSPAAVIEIAITPAQNAIRSPGNATELKRVTVRGVYGASDEVNEQHDHLVKNLSGVS